MVAVYGATRFEFNEPEDLKNYTVFLADVTHGSPPWKPLYFIDGWGRWAYRSIQRAAERLSLPTTKGWDIRYIDGYPYPTVIETSPQEAKEREAAFREKIAPYIIDFDAVWDGWKADIMQAYAGLKSKYGLARYDDIHKLSNVDLRDLFDDFMQVDRKQWDIHMEMMVPSYYLYGLFDQMCRELLGFGAADPQFAPLVTGFDSMVVRFNKEIWRLGARAVELGLESFFQNIEDNEAVLAALEQKADGRTWLREYRDFLEVHGWRCERMQDWATPTWIEKPGLGIPLLKLAISSGAAVSTLDEKRAQAVREREAAEKEVLSRVAVSQRDWFTALLKAAQKAGYWNEDHNYYLDLYCCAIGRWITREIGSRFAAAGVIDDDEDVYFLLADEIEKAMIPLSKVRLQRYADQRRREWESYLKITPKPFYGNIEKVQDMVKKDPVITASTSARVVKEEAKADLYSAASAPGTAEGIARVITSEEKLVDVQPGEILVVPGISAQWTPAFEVISGIVTDGGGALSHAVILAREYGIPAVVGCLEATKKIRTGDRVKMDGNLGLVYILKP
jgi:pyruvate,water dikinase